jgi:asparagine synthase (glutamine-hydrolysing)
MLRTPPESLQEELPLATQSGALVITADARIDNRNELIEALHLRHRPSGHIPDSQFILAAYENWGERCPEHLLGDFAFAIWDRRAQALFVVYAIIFGVKPLYYFYRPRQAFACASEIKALLCLPRVPCHLNELRVADYLVRIFEDKAITFYKDTFRLPAGHSMTVGNAGIGI